MFPLFCWIVNCAVVNQSEIKFYTYINAPNFTAQIIPYDDLSTLLLTSNKPVRFLSHGWRQNYKTQWIDLAVSGYYKQNELRNIIVIDWSEYSGNIWYPHAARDTEAVSNIVGKMVVMICRELGVPLWNVHFVASSLGAHMFGFAGKYIFTETGEHVGRITGLDPAGSNFEEKPIEKRLDKSDANFVDVIHTDIYFLGFKGSLGHIDYFPNGGYGQPGCSFILLDVYCNHRRAALYYAESINSDRFKAWKCHDYNMFQQHSCAKNKQVVIGHSFGLDYDTEGSYYMATNENPPFGCNC